MAVKPTSIKQHSLKTSLNIRGYSGVKYTVGRLKFKQQPSNIAKKIKKETKQSPAQPEAPLMNRPEFVTAPYPTRSQKS